MLADEKKPKDDDNAKESKEKRDVSDDIEKKEKQSVWQARVIDSEKIGIQLKKDTKPS